MGTHTEKINTSEDALLKLPYRPAPLPECGSARRQVSAVGLDPVLAVDHQLVRVTLTQGLGNEAELARPNLSHTQQAFGTPDGCRHCGRDIVTGRDHSSAMEFDVRVDLGVRTRPLALHDRSIDRRSGRQNRARRGSQSGSSDHQRPCYIQLRRHSVSNHYSQAVARRS